MAAAPRVASIIVFDSRDDAYVAQARLRAMSRKARRVAFLKASNADHDPDPDLPPSANDSYHGLVSQLQLQGVDAPPTDASSAQSADLTVDPIKGYADAQRKLMETMREHRSLFWFLDHAAQVVPSMVHSAPDLYDAIKSEGWLFDSIVITDVDSPEVADVLCAELIPMLGAWETVMEGHSRRAAGASSSSPATTARSTHPTGTKSSIGERLVHAKGGSSFVGRKCVPRIVLVASQRTNE